MKTRSLEQKPKTFSVKVNISSHEKIRVLINSHLQDYAEVMKADNDIETLMQRLLHPDENVVSAVCEALAACITEHSLLPIVHDLGLKGVIGKLLKTVRDVF